MENIDNYIKKFKASSNLVAVKELFNTILFNFSLIYFQEDINKYLFIITLSLVQLTILNSVAAAWSFLRTNSCDGEVVPIPTLPVGKSCKSAFAVSTAFSPRGFADQGAKVLMVCNEEIAERTMDRAGSAYSALETDDVVNDRLKGRVSWDGIKDNIALMATYDVQNGDTPETLSYKHFGSTDYFWVILMNHITDRYYQWPLSDSAFEEYVTQKYDNPGAVHHYEKDQSSGSTTGEGPADYEHKIEVNSDDADGQSVSNYEYESRLQDKKRQIKLLNKSFLGDFISEFDRLIAE